MLIQGLAPQRIPCQQNLQKPPLSRCKQAGSPFHLAPGCDTAALLNSYQPVPDLEPGCSF